MGTEPTAAARWMAYWPRLSLTRAEAEGEWSRRRRARSMFFLEETKWSAVCGVECYFGREKGENMCGGKTKSDAAYEMKKLTWPVKSEDTLVLHLGLEEDSLGRG